MAGNTVKLLVLVYNLTGSNTPTITASLEGGVLGQYWESISDSGGGGGAVLTDTWGAASNSSDAIVTHSLIRVRVRVSADVNGDCKAWFNVGLALTEQ